MANIINWNIIREPLNWLTVWTIAAIGVLLVAAIMRHPAVADISVS